MKDELNEEEINEIVDEMVDEEPQYITLTDAEGNDVEFEILDFFTLDEKDYIALAKVEENNDTDSDEFLLLEVVTDPENEDIQEMIGIDDDAVIEKVFKEFVERNKDIYDFEE